MDNSPEVVVLVGLPGSGKSSFYRTRFAATHEHLSKDNWPNVKKREARLQRELRAAMQARRNVIIDNTNVSRAARGSVLCIALEYKAHVIGYVFEANLEECLRRNVTREGKARVPDVAIHVMRANWQAPERAEGFDDLFVVRLRDGDFEVTDYNEPATI